MRIDRYCRGVGSNFKIHWEHRTDVKAKVAMPVADQVNLVANVSNRIAEIWDTWREKKK